ncbi:ATP-binding protein [Halovenus marina]|uniref:ATP-binding protein n=1 Tax=Halovenus marina TaxID=3396621 RepID=UPI003F57E464
MTFVIGRATDDDRPTGLLGTYRALDGSEGAPLRVDLDGPHAVCVVGKRGYGKSYTIGVIAEELARTDGVAPVVVDPMGIFDTLTEPAEGDPVPADVIDDPWVTPDTLDPRSWCDLLGLSPESGPGSLLWQATAEASTLSTMRAHVEAADAPETHSRGALNHIQLADSWNVFDKDGLDASALATDRITVLDLSGLDSAPMNAVCRAVGETLYRARVTGAVDRLPWLLVDEAHTFFAGVAQHALERILTRGRAPGVSLVVATQQPSAIPPVGVAQSDILVSHRLTARADITALREARPTYARRSLDERMPERPGAASVVDDATETVHAVQIRTRDTPHGGGSPSVSVDRCADSSAGDERI